MWVAEGATLVGRWMARWRWALLAVDIVAAGSDGVEKFGDEVLVGGSVLIMHFPSRAAFIQTLNHSDYHAMHRHRDAGLLCQELITTRPAD